jgi:CheY-like chemotaxis protein
MRDGGVLTVDAKNCVLDEQYVSMNLQAKPGRFVKITVADTGGGLLPEIVDRIFEPFFATQDLDEGTGLRLSTVMAIVKSHGGSISVDSEPRKGTTFNVYLPTMETAVETRKGNEEPLERPRGNGETILVVDDEAPILTVTSRTLKSFGYQVLTATDGAAAVSIYAERQDQIAAVLTDVMMPIMGGAAMLHALMEINPSVKVIVASGCNTINGTPGERLPGVKYSLIKPYTSATLLTTLRKLLDEP